MLELQNLVPGLPDDIGRECLLRIPYDRLSLARFVSAHWKHELESPDFHRIRQNSRLAQTILVLAQAEPTPCSNTEKNLLFAPAYRLTVYEPETSTWRNLPLPSELPFGLPLFCQLAGVGHELVVVGGCDPKTWLASDRVFVYDFLSATWRCGARMPGPRRSFFACAASDAGDPTVFVAGGHDERKDAMKSAFAYDVAGDRWAPLPDMAAERDECCGVFLRGRFHVIGGYETQTQGCFGKSGESYYLEARSWGLVEEDKIPACTCPRTCVAARDARMYMCVEGKLMVLQSDTWHTLTELPGNVRTALHLVPWEGNLMVTGAGSSGREHVAYTMKLEEKRKPLTWQKVELPEDYSGHVQAACCLKI